MSLSRTIISPKMQAPQSDREQGITGLFWCHFCRAGNSSGRWVFRPFGAADDHGGGGR
jgi:hypothetical protein